MTIINITDDAMSKIEKLLFSDIDIVSTQIVRLALLHLKQSKPSREQIFSLIGKSATDSLLIDSLEEEN